ncbi:MAG: aldehyde dehydrogenase [Pseudonocardiales bacterium]|jgi:betaine-aldehyde dehydrogenase|nr:aldehyde dehydrogenase [Pseudonocardiales bacterium]
MKTYDTLYIGGQWQAPLTERRIEVHSPATGELVGSVPHAGAEEVDAAVEAAREAFDHGPWPRLTLAERLAVLSRMRDHLQAHQDELDELGTRENGVTIAVRPGLAALRLFDYTLGAAQEYVFSERRTGLSGRKGTVVREPVGVVGAIVASNGPLLQSVGKSVPALVTGCTVVLKPPVETPLIVMALADAAEAAGLPPGVLNIVPGDVAEGQQLVAHPGIDAITFTGSAAAGREIGKQCGQQLKRATLELGGKSAGIVLPDADLASAAAVIAGGCMAFAGQRCAAISRAFVPVATFEESVRAIVDAVSALVVGDPLAAGTFVGPLVSQRGLDRVVSYVDAAVAGGATVVLGGARMADRDGYYFQPTVFVDVTNDMAIAREEVFGPVLCVIPYDTVEDAIAQANDNEYGLTASVFSTDHDEAERVARRIRAGSIGINAAAGDIGLPFGGYKSSGYGREYSIEAFDDFTEVKAIA